MVSPCRTRQHARSERPEKSVPARQSVPRSRRQCESAQTLGEGRYVIVEVVKVLTAALGALIPSGSESGSTWSTNRSLTWSSNHDGSKNNGVGTPKTPRRAPLQKPNSTWHVPRPYKRIHDRMFRPQADPAAGQPDRPNAMAERLNNAADPLPLTRELARDTIGGWEIAEEIKSFGKLQRSELKSQSRRILKHPFKLVSSPSVEPRDGWLTTIRDASPRSRISLKTARASDGSWSTLSGNNAPRRPSSPRPI